VKVSVVRGGGVAGIATRTELSVGDLADEDARAFADKVRAAALPEQHVGGGDRVLPDQMLYEVVLDDGRAVVRSRFTDEDIPEGVRRLVEWIDGRPERTSFREV